MECLIPTDIFTGATEIACYVCAAITALVSFFLTCR